MTVVHAKMFVDVAYVFVVKHLLKTKMFCNFRNLLISLTLFSHKQESIREHTKMTSCQKGGRDMNGHMTNNDMGREGVLANNDVMKSQETKNINKLLAQTTSGADHNFELKLY